MQCLTGLKTPKDCLSNCYLVKLIDIKSNNHKSIVFLAKAKDQVA